MICLAELFGVLFGLLLVSVRFPPLGITSFFSRSISTPIHSGKSLLPSPLTHELPLDSRVRMLFTQEARGCCLEKGLGYQALRPPPSVWFFIELSIPSNARAGWEGGGGETLFIKIHRPSPCFNSKKHPNLLMKTRSDLQILLWNSKVGLQPSPPLSLKEKLTVFRWIKSACDPFNLQQGESAPRLSRGLRCLHRGPPTRLSRMPLRSLRP